MEFLSTLSDIARWMIITSLKATIVIALIMMIRLLFGERLPAKWQHALWFVLMVRLVLPINMPTPFSLFNLTEKVPYRPAPPPHLNIDYTPPPIEKPAVLSFEVRQKQNPQISDSEVLVQSYSFSPMEIMGLVWLLGLTSLLLYSAGLNLVIWLRFRKARPLEDSRLSRILLSSQKKLGVRRQIRLFQIDKTTSPFWFGHLKPRIYFPSALIESLSDEDLEHIFLHELAHFKRRDIVVSMMQTLLQAAHWFNPLIWYSFAKMRNDRETACDEMVLHTLGQHRSEAYGLTLISLLRYANRNGFMPVTVGLADTQEDIRHRIDRIANFTIKSKWWEVLMLVLVLFISLLALTSATESATISGEITFQDGARPDTIYVGLYDYNWRDDFFGSGGEAQALHKLTNQNNYKFNVEKGLYTVVTWGFGYENAHFKVYIPDDKTDLKINFELAKKGLPETISHIALIGDYCDWDQSKATQLTQNGDIWFCNAPLNMGSGQKYKYFVWEKGITGFSEFLLDPTNKPMFRYSPSGTKMQVSKDWGTFDHIYDGEKQFVLDTGKFQRPIKEAKITTSGWELADQFNRLFEDKYMLVLESVNPLNQPGSHSKFDKVSHFYKMYAKWDSLEAAYDPFFRDMFVEQKLYMYQLFSPMRNRKNPLYNPRITKEDSIAFLNSESFHNDFGELVSLVKHLDPDSYFYGGLFVYNLLEQIPSYLQKWPVLEKKYDITVDDCLALLHDFSDNAKNPYTRQSVLYSMQSRYTKMDSTALAQKYRKQLFDEFPDGPYVKHIEEEKTRTYWDKVSPYPAPNFSVTTLDGESISLTDYRGTFVFVDFWGSWCAPCKREIPEIIDMAQYIPEEKLKIIGLANDDEKSLRQYVKQNNINYANALADKELLAAWDIKSYPTNFLIDPEGNVIGKNFRGGSQFYEVSTEMERWEKERSE